MDAQAIRESVTPLMLMIAENRPDRGRLHRALSFLATLTDSRIGAGGPHVRTIQSAHRTIAHAIQSDIMDVGCTDDGFTVTLNLVAEHLWGAGRVYRAGAWETDDTVRVRDRWTREAILAALRSRSEAVNRPLMRQDLYVFGMPKRTFYREFQTLQEGCEAAGVAWEKIKHGRNPAAVRP